MAVRDSDPLNPSLGDKPLEQSLCRAPTRTGPPTRGRWKSNFKKYTYIQARGLFTSRLGGSSVFFEAEPRFGVKVISRLTQPQNREEEPNIRARYT